MRKKWFVRAMLLAVIVLTAVGLDPRMIVRTYTVETDKLDAPVRLAVVADFHGCNYGKDAARLVQAVVELQPDAVLLPGDIFDEIHRRWFAALGSAGPATMCRAIMKAGRINRTALNKSSRRPA
ncbi:MAG: hypothetical protein ACI4ME_05245 [Aristaeellaceae bacterium]